MMFITVKKIEVGKALGEELAEKALAAVEEQLGAKFEESAYFFLRSHLTGNFKRFYMDENNELRSAAYDSIIENHRLTKLKKKG